MLPALTSIALAACARRCPYGQHYQPDPASFGNKCQRDNRGDAFCGCSEYELDNKCHRCPADTWVGDQHHRGTRQFCQPGAAAKGAAAPQQPAKHRNKQPKQPGAQPDKLVGHITHADAFGRSDTGSWFSRLADRWRSKPKKPQQPPKPKLLLKPIRTDSLHNALHKRPWPLDASKLTTAEKSRLTSALKANGIPGKLGGNSWQKPKPRAKPQQQRARTRGGEASAGEQLAHSSPWNRDSAVLW